MIPTLMSAPTLLTGKRVLVVEDEALVSMLIEDFLAELGCKVVGIATRFGDALKKAGDLALDIAVLDINLAGIKSFPVAELLRDRRIPFLFLSGYGRAGLSAEFRDSPILSKPFSMEQLLLMLSSVCVVKEAHATWVS